MDLQDDEDPLVQIQMKYAEALEEILKCPVCLEQPDGLIPVCSKGHHICNVCRKTRNKCPKCDGDFSNARNYMGESLASTFDKIKKSILDPNQHVNKKIKKHDGETQTDPLNFYKINAATNDSTTKNNKGNVLEKKTAQKSKYKCIKTFCEHKSIFNEIAEHIKEKHEGVLIEVEPKTGVVFYENTWTLKFEASKNIDYAINVKNIGLFYFSICVDENQTITSTLKNISNNLAISKYYYYISFESGLSSKGFDGTVVQEKTENNQINSESNSVTYKLENMHSLIACTLRLFNNNPK